MSEYRIAMTLMTADGDVLLTNGFMVDLPYDVSEVRDTAADAAEELLEWFS